MAVRRNIHRGSAVWLACLATAALFTGCSTPFNRGGTKPEPYKISVMLPSYVSGQLPDNTSPVVQELGRYTDTSVDLLWVPLTTYQDKTKIVMSSSKLPSIMVVLGKSPEFIHAAQRGMFWELGPYLKDYPNLREANQTVLRNISVDGRIYSLYRTRELGRYGVTIRKDWLDRVGLPLPKTIEELYEVLKAFTLHDPDGDGKQNTYGLAISYPATFDVLQTWFGAPNQWGKDEDGGLVPVHLTAEYRESLRFLKKLYEEGLIDPHFAVKDPKFVRDPLVHGEAGMLVDVADQAQRIASDIEKAYGLTDVIDVFSGVEGPQGLRLPSNSGYDGMLAVSTSAVKTEQELRRVLDFLDKLNDKEMQVLLTSGIQGRHYQKTPEMKDVDYNYEKDDLNKLLMYIPEVRTLPKAESPIRTKVQEVMKANESILVDNPAEAFISQTYMKNGPALDLIISDARIQFIIGQIDEAGWEQAMVQWRQNGGDAYMEEINRQYREAGSK